MRQALVAGPFQGLAQVRGLLGQHRDDLVQVAVGGGPGDAVVAGQRIGGWCGRGTSAAPAPPARSRSAPGCRAGCRAGAARRQQPRGELGQFPGDVKRGTIGDHVEPPAEGDLVVRPLLLGLHAHLRAARFVRVSARMPRVRLGCLPGGAAVRQPGNAAAITVMVSPGRARAGQGRAWGSLMPVVSDGERTRSPR